MTKLYRMFWSFDGEYSWSLTPIELADSTDIFEITDEQVSFLKRIGVLQS